MDSPPIGGKHERKSMMENNNPTSGKTRANRILYAVIVSVICIGAIIAGIAASIARRDDPNSLPGGTTPPATSTPDADTSGEPVVFTAPLIGDVAKGHDLTLPVYSTTLNEYRTHGGIDIAAEAGSKVVAAADGTVAEITEDPLLGYSVSINHAGGLVTVYRNLAAELADGMEVGATVTRGQEIGTIGDSALIEVCDEPHLHFEMTLAGTAVDPLDYISEESISASAGNYEDA
jgi:murein DD-endopeptidase MepM/ murein hydrolase activator NlpD